MPGRASKQDKKGEMFRLTIQRSVDIDVDNLQGWRLKTSIRALQFASPRVREFVQYTGVDNL